MKKLLLPVAFVAAIGFTACGGGDCDLSTAAGAAKCYCAEEDKEAKGKLEEKIEAEFEKGTYSENDIEAEMEKIEDCH